MKLSCKKFFEYVIYETTDTYDFKKTKINRQYDIFNLSDYMEGKDIILPIKIDYLGYISKNIKVCDYGKFKNYLEYGNYKIGIT